MASHIIINEEMHDKYTDNDITPIDLGLTPTHLDLNVDLKTFLDDEPQHTLL